MTAIAITHAEFKLLPATDLQIIAYHYTDGEEDVFEVLDPVAYRTVPLTSEPGRCACCGKRIRYSARVHVVSREEAVEIGLQCASRVEALEGVGNVKLTYLKDRAVLQRTRRRWLEANPGLEDLLGCAQQSDRDIARDLAAKFWRYGSLSEKQVDLLIRLKEQADARAAKDAEFAPKAPAPEGRVEVAVEVLGFKEVESQWGVTTKMIARVVDTFAKVWLTVPSKCNGGDIERGSRVRLTATFERSQKDPFFAFGSRPSKATLIKQ